MSIYVNKKMPPSQKFFLGSKASLYSVLLSVVCKLVRYIVRDLRNSR